MVKLDEFDGTECFYEIFVLFQQVEMFLVKFNKLCQFLFDSGFGGNDFSFQAFGAPVVTVTQSTVHLNQIDDLL